MGENHLTVWAIHAGRSGDALAVEQVKALLGEMVAYARRQA